MAYLIDASTLIEAKDRNYPFDICPGFWDWLDKQNDSGVVFSINRIRMELEAGNDALAVWAKSRGAAFFLPIDPPVAPAMARISLWAITSGFRPQAHTEFLG